jgi:hypothetical protein
MQRGVRHLLALLHHMEPPKPKPAPPRLPSEPPPPQTTVRQSTPRRGPVPPPTREARIFNKQTNEWEWQLPPPIQLSQVMAREDAEQAEEGTSPQDGSSRGGHCWWTVVRTDEPPWPSTSTNLLPSPLPSPRALMRMRLVRDSLHGSGVAGSGLSAVLLQQQQQLPHERHGLPPLGRHVQPPLTASPPADDTYARAEGVWRHAARPGCRRAWVPWEKATSDHAAAAVSVATAAAAGSAEGASHALPSAAVGNEASRSPARLPQLGRAPPATARSHEDAVSEHMHGVQTARAEPPLVPQLSLAPHLSAMQRLQTPMEAQRHAWNSFFTLVSPRYGGGASGAAMDVVRAARVESARGEAKLDADWWMRLQSASPSAML